MWHRLVPEVQSLMDGLVETRLCLASAAMQDLPTNRIQLTPEEKNFYSHLRLVIVDSIAAPFAPYISLFTMESEFIVINNIIIGVPLYALARHWRIVNKFHIVVDQ